MKKKLVFALILAALVAGFASAQTIYDFKLINRSGYTITNAYVAEAGSTDYSDDILNEYVLENNYSYQINFDQDLADYLMDWGVDLYDIYFIDEDGDDWTIRNVRLEAISEITITFSGGTMRYTAR